MPGNPLPGYTANIRFAFYAYERGVWTTEIPAWLYYDNGLSELPHELLSSQGGNQ